MRPTTHTFIHPQMLRIAASNARRTRAKVFLTGCWADDTLIGSHTANGGGRALLLIDALDEAEYEQKNELAALLATELAKLPEWLGVVATSRPERPLRDKLAPLRPTHMSAAAYAADCAADERLFLCELLSPLVSAPRLQAEVARVAAKARGVFLYLHWLRERVRALPTRIQVTRVPNAPGKGA